MTLEEAVHGFRIYYAGLPSKIKAKDLLRKRPLAIYAAMGISTPHELASTLVTDRLAASREMAMGYLYERVLEDACNAEKLNNAQKKEWRGIDFRKSLLAELDLINLKSARATSNSDISQQTLANLEAAARHAAALEQASLDDNPLPKQPRTIRAIRGIARGHARKSIRNQNGVDIEVLVGDALWEGLGAGTDLTRRLQELLATVPIDRVALATSTAQAVERVEQAIRVTECVRADGTIDWPGLFLAYPDA